MDETPVYFDMTGGATFHIKGAKNVLQNSTGYDKLRYTVVLACTASGIKLRTMVIFKNLVNVPKLPTGKKWPKGELSSLILSYSTFPA